MDKELNVVESANAEVGTIIDDSSKPKKARTPSLNATDFVKIWQQNRGNVDAIVAKHGGNSAHLRHRANTLRKKGVPLVETVVKSGGKPLDLDELSRLASEFANT